MRPQIPLSASAIADAPPHDHVHAIVSDVAYQRTLISNIVYVGPPGAGDRRWLLIDTGMPGFTGSIRRAAAQRFGPDARPFAIILTHGHFDHIGTVRQLVAEWDCPVFAHPNEHPFLDGSDAYPPPNPWAGGLMSLTAPLLPRGPIDLRPYLRALPSDHFLPGMPGWQWIETPGHAPGHISLWRPRDRFLIAGDAFITTRQESAYAALVSQRPEMHGPPAYFTSDWPAARLSVQRLARLMPSTVITGHGHAMQGPEMRTALERLADYFDDIAVPRSARRQRFAEI